jgi:hypothetical protein
VRYKAQVQVLYQERTTQVVETLEIFEASVSVTLVSASMGAAEVNQIG